MKQLCFLSLMIIALILSISSILGQIIKLPNAVPPKFSATLSDFGKRTQLKGQKISNLHDLSYLESQKNPTYLSRSQNKKIRTHNTFGKRTQRKGRNITDLLNLSYLKSQENRTSLRSSPKKIFRTPKKFGKRSQLKGQNITNLNVLSYLKSQANQTYTKSSPKKKSRTNKKFKFSKERSILEEKAHRAEQKRLLHKEFETESRHFYASALCMWKDQMRKILGKETECIETCVQRFSDRLEDDQDLAPGSEFFLRKLKKMLRTIRKFSNLVIANQSPELYSKILKEKRKMFWYIWDMLSSSSLIPQEFRDQAREKVERLKKVTTKTKNDKSSLPETPQNKKLKNIHAKFYSRNLQITKFFDTLGRLILHDPKPEGRYEDCKTKRRILKGITLQMSAKVIGDILTKLSYLPEYPKGKITE